MKRGLGVIIARFQTHSLTDAHRYLIDQVATRSDRICVLLGVAPVLGTKKNPMEFLLRERMVYEYLHARHAEKDSIVLPLADCPSNDDWARKFDDLIAAVSVGHRVTVYSGPDGAVPVYRSAGGRYPCQIIDHIGVHATDIRESVGPKYTEDFRAGVVYACEKRFPSVFPTVDMAIMREDQILLGQKYEDRGKWRLPGGFVDPGDASLERAAVRETLEECRLVLSPGSLLYCGSLIVNDWRYRSGPEATMTSVFRVKWNHAMGEPRHGDDLDDLAWHPLKGVQELIHDVHVPVLERALITCV